MGQGRSTKIISMIKWIRTRRLSIKNSLSGSVLVPKPYTLHPTPYTLHPTPYALRPTPYALHPMPYTLQPTPYTQHGTSDDEHGGKEDGVLCRPQVERLLWQHLRHPAQSVSRQAAVAQASCSFLCRATAECSVVPRRARI